nr:nucleotidyl transferase AbiEii/AbiGii toxin family protein [Actinoplanes sp. ATCC 53533]
MGSPRRFRRCGRCCRRRISRDGYAVEVVQQFETFARLAVTDSATPDRPYKVELAANWRSLPPVMMDIGPVLHIDDVVAGKMSALFTRAEPRDFLDVDAAVSTGRYDRRQLLELAEQADAGFDRQIFADLLAMLQRYPDRRFASYNAAPDHIAAMRERFAQWRDDLLADWE